MTKYLLSNSIRQKAQELGFDDCKFAQATELSHEAGQLEKWLSQGMHGEMKYLANHFEMRVDPRKLMPGTKSVIVLSSNYYSESVAQSDVKVSKYAFGEDYHKVIKKKHKRLMRFIQEKEGNVSMRSFVDSAPIMERAWAQKAGLGWIGKNSLLLTKGKGSFFFLSIILMDVELIYDAPVKDYCGSCTKCIDACPTQAIVQPYVVDGSRCISYFTIEYREQSFPENEKLNFENWMFGCDICQDVCPINARSQPNQEVAFTPKLDLLNLKADDWLRMQEEDLPESFQKSPLKRSGLKGIQRNVRFLKNGK